MCQPRDAEWAGTLTVASSVTFFSPSRRGEQRVRLCDGNVQAGSPAAGRPQGGCQREEGRDGGPGQPRLLQAPSVCFGLSAHGPVAAGAPRGLRGRSRPRTHTRLSTPVSQRVGSRAALLVLDTAQLMFSPAVVSPLLARSSLRRSSQSLWFGPDSFIPTETRCFLCC